MDALPTFLSRLPLPEGHEAYGKSSYIGGTGWNLRSLVPNPLFFSGLASDLFCLIFHCFLLVGRQAIKKTCKECRGWKLPTWETTLEQLRSGGLFWFQILIFHFQPQEKSPTTSSDGEIPRKNDKGPQTKNIQRKFTMIFSRFDRNIHCVMKKGDDKKNEQNNAIQLVKKRTCKTMLHTLNAWF